VGGHCISIDPFYLLSIRDSEFIKTTRKVNDEQPLYVVEQILNIIKEKELVDPKIGVLGVAYKKNVDDSRETPALKIIETLLEKGYTLYVTDPYVKNFEYELTELDNTLENTDIIIIATGHDCYKNVDFSKHIVYDCANMDIKCKEYYILGDGRK
jgi:UDP-N-acetyl-D-mannosaminuronic acid dehydrogenase